MQWTVRLEARTSQGVVTTTEPATFSRPAMIGTLAEIGLVLSETRTLQASMLCGQVAEYGVRGASERKTYVRPCRATCRGASPFCDIHLQ